MSTPSEIEYAARIARVQDHVDRHLAEDLRLEVLARVACFSPFHFHRVFAACVGETLREYVLRLRLERAVSLLLARPHVPVTDVALDCGFRSGATFARAFRAAYGMSASEIRKRCKADRNACKAPHEGEGYRGDEPHALLERTRRMTMEATVPAQEIAVRDLPERTLAYLRHVGPYAGDGALFGRLWGEFFAWAGPRGLFVPGRSEMICVYHDDPGVTEPERLRISLGVTVPPGTPTGGRVNLLTLPAGRHVCARFEIDPSLYGAAWATVMGDWLPKSGYQPGDGPAYECYLNDPKTHPQGKHVFEIRLPVVPL